MKKLLFPLALAALAAIAALSPESPRDVGRLLPAQTLIVAAKDGGLTITGDGGLSGTGADWAAALQNLRDTAPGQAFLDSTGHIVLMDGAEKALPDVLADQALRPAARVFAGSGEMKPEDATKFLQAHEAGVTLQQLQAAALESEAPALPVLTCQDGRYQLKDG